MIVVNMDRYKDILEYLEDEQLKELEFYIKENRELKNQIKSLQMEIEKLKGNNSRGAGRKSKFSEMEKTEIQMYRFQGKTLKEIAEMFDCSTKTIQRILKSIE